MKQLIIFILLILFLNVKAESAKDHSVADSNISIKPVDDLKTIKEFAGRYSRYDGKADMDPKSLKIDQTLGATTQPYFRGHNGLPYLLYRVDINNDDQIEWVLVHVYGGTMNTSGIDGVYKNKGHTLESLPFDNLIISTFHIGEMSSWYFFTADPVLTLEKGKTVMNFYKTDPAQVCSYIWQNNKITFVHGDQTYCIH